MQEVQFGLPANSPTQLHPSLDLRNIAGAPIERDTFSQARFNHEIDNLPRGEDAPNSSAPRQDQPEESKEPQQRDHGSWRQTRESVGSEDDGSDTEQADEVTETTMFETARLEMLDGDAYRYMGRNCT